MTTAAYSSREIGWAIAAATCVQSAFFVVIVAIASADSLKSKDPPAEMEVPVAVQPVIDEINLAKLGGKKVKYKLPDMWQKPVPVKRYEAKSAPTPMAEKTVEAIPSSEAVKPDEEAPPKDAEVVKQAPDVPQDVQKLKEQPNLPDQGFSDGYEEGKETDALKAMWVSRYRITVTNWLRGGFSTNGLDCAEVKGKSAVGTVQVSGGGSVQSFSLSSSGAGTLDERANAALQSKVGQQLPPPPENLDASEFYGKPFSVQFNKRCE